MKRLFSAVQRQHDFLVNWFKWAAHLNDILNSSGQSFLFQQEGKHGNVDWLTGKLQLKVRLQSIGMQSKFFFRVANRTREFGSWVDLNRKIYENCSFASLCLNAFCGVVWWNKITFRPLKVWFDKNHHFIWRAPCKLFAIFLCFSACFFIFHTPEILRAFFGLILTQKFILIQVDAHFIKITAGK